MSDTRQQIILLADELIRRKGFNAFSYADIAVQMGVRNAAIHYHFPAKTDLGAAVIDRELARMIAYRRLAKDRPGDFGLKLVFTIFDRTHDRNLICLMGSLTPDIDTFDHRMQQKVAELSAFILEEVAESLERSRQEGKVKFKGEALARASMVVSVLMSSLLLSRVHGDEALFLTMLDQLLDDLEADWRIADLKNDDLINKEYEKGSRNRYGSDHPAGE